jgi:hypothetical protein
MGAVHFGRNPKRRSPAGRTLRLNSARYRPRVSALWEQLLVHDLRRSPARLLGFQRREHRRVQNGSKKFDHARPGSRRPTAGKEREKIFLPKGSLQPFEKAQFGQENPRKSKPFPLIYFARLGRGLAGFGQIWNSLGQATTTHDCPNIAEISSRHSPHGPSIGPARLLGRTFAFCPRSRSPAPCCAC